METKRIQLATAEDINKLNEDLNMFKNPTQQLAGDEDLNTVTDVGRYGMVAYVSNVGNLPEALYRYGATVFRFELIVKRIGGSTASTLTQELTCFNTNNKKDIFKYTRAMLAGVWGDWKEITNTDEWEAITSDTDIKNYAEKLTCNHKTIRILNPINAPSGIGDAHFEIYKLDPSWIRIICIDIRTNDIYTIQKTYAVWGSWSKLMSSGSDWTEIPFRDMLDTSISSSTQGGIFYPDGNVYMKCHGYDDYLHNILNRKISSEGFYIKHISIGYDIELGKICLYVRWHDGTQERTEKFASV